jgi:hypothetical protein
MGQRGIISDMPLALYRRHRQECKGGHAHNARTSEYDERKKGLETVRMPHLRFWNAPQKIQAA